MTASHDVHASVPPGVGDRLPTKLNVRDVIAATVWAAMKANPEDIATVRDVQQLPALRSVPGERIAVAIADLVADGLVIGASGAGRIRAIECAA